MRQKPKSRTINCMYEQALTNARRDTQMQTDEKKNTNNKLSWLERILFDSDDRVRRNGMR